MSKNPTEDIINEYWESFSKDIDYKTFKKCDYKSLEKLLEKLVEENLPTFKDYISEYIYKKHKELKKYKDYHDIPEEEIWACIKNDFKDNGLENKGDLDPKSKDTLEQKKSIFKISGVNIDVNRGNERLEKTMHNARKDVFLFAFGLKMNTNDVSRMLCNALLTYDFNPKEYKEVIYYWCLNEKNADKITTPYLKMLELLKFYDNIPKDINNVNKENRNTNTILLKEKIDDIHDEDELKNYLVFLKNFKVTSEDKKLRGITQAFDETITGLKDSLDTPPGGIVKFKIENGLENDYDDIEDIGIEKLVKEIKDKRKKIYDEYITQSNYALIKREVLGKLFEGLVFSKKTFYGRKSTKNKKTSKTYASRRELLLNYFIIFCDDKENEDGNEDWYTNFSKRYLDFDEYIADIFEKCNMSSHSVYYEPGLYLRNPFELFLAICLLHENPLEYFMASWQEAEQYNEYKNI